ncbi:MAG: TfoX/Sxy family protein [Alphaproteobacteria bacterium]
MSISQSFAEFLTDAFVEFGPITIRKMFGGAGVYKDGVMFALVADDVLYLKADADLAGQFKAQNMSQFVFTPASGKTIAMSYWRAPDILYDDSEQMADWAARSHRVAAKTKLAKKSRPGSEDPGPALRSETSSRN